MKPDCKQKQKAPRSSALEQLAKRPRQKRPSADTRTRQQVFDEICNQLNEFFDAAIVSVTWTEGGCTNRLHQDIGNQYTVNGLLEAISSEHSDEVLGLAENDEDDEDNEGWKKGKEPA